ncbi:MAG: penicillin-insensitive murein endopeptidase [Deltaproteobacteria bacterium]|nr:penicillin-insensitive murein endopeptidase [Deltaproteobacteria bacterium]
MTIALTLVLSAFAAEYGPLVEGTEGDEIAAGGHGQADTGVVGCSDQYLGEGIDLPELPLFYYRAQPSHSWGSREMVEVIVDTSRHLRWLMPEADPLTIGDISSERGGFLSGHKSHRGGIDADIGIYMAGGKQDPRGFTALGPGTFDLERNWMLISTLLDTGKIDMILLDRGHIERLRAYTVRAGLLTDDEAEHVFPSEGSRASWENVGIVRHAPNHADHLHVRVLCADGSKADAR